MKKRWICIFLILLTAVFVLVACDVNIDDGKIDGIDELPLQVEVTGLEGVTGKAEVKLLTSTQEATALAAVKDVYYVKEGSEFYAVDISLTDNGEEVKVGKPVTVTIALPQAQLPLDKYVVFHIHDGIADEIVPTVSEGKLTFTVEGFSPFVVVPAHVHEYGEWRTYSEATCTEAKTEIRECVCKAKETRRVGEALGHEMRHHAAVSESCTQDGNVEYFSCTRCGKYFLEAEGFTEILPANTVVSAPGHVDADRDGKCDACGVSLGGEEPQGDLPCTVEVVGANGSVLTAEVRNMSAADKASALALIRKKYHLDEDAATYAVDISIQNAAVGTVARVSITLKNPALSLNRYAVYHIHNGDVEMIEPDVAGGNLVFTVSSFSPFIIGPKHLHQPSDLIVETPASCLSAGVGYIECVKCHERLETKSIPALPHVDKNEDGTCDVCGANLKEPETPEVSLAGKLFTFDRVEGEGINAANYQTAYADATFSFFADNYMEYHVYRSVRGSAVSDFNVVLCGNYAISEGESGSIITLTVTKRYYDDEETMIPFPTYTFGFDANTASVSVTENDGMGHEATIYYTEDVGATPTLYAPPALADNWDDAVVIAAFRALGADKDYTLPKLDNVLSMSKSDVDMGQVTVTVKMASKMEGGEAASNYIDLLVSGYFNYEWNVGEGKHQIRLNTDDNLFWFTAATGNEGGYPVLTISMGRFAPAYPDAGIVNFLTEHEMTDDILEFTTPWAMDYRFVTDNSENGLACIRVYLRFVKGGERHDTEVAAAFTDRLTKEFGYHAQTVGGRSYLCSEHDQIFLRVVTGEVGNVVSIYVNDQSVIYPAAAIAAYLAGTDDEFIDLDNDGVFGYELHSDESDNPTALRLVGKMPFDADAHAVIASFRNDFSGAGYQWGGFATHFGNEEDVSLYHHAWISPDQEIAIIFAAFNQGEHELGDFAYYSVSIVNLTAIPDNNKAIMTSLGAAGYATSVNVGGTYTFNGGIAFLYTNVGTGLEGGGLYTYEYDLLDIGTIDTSVPGNQTLRISLKGNAGIYTDVTVLVLGLTDISATANLAKIDGRIAYYSAQWKLQQDYTITKTYSDGHSTSVKGNTEGISFSDIDGSKVKQDLTISCTEGGVTVTTTVAIGLFKSVNYTCTDEWDVSADDAEFALYVVGGAYGEGAWAATSFESRRGNFSGSVYMDATTLYFVRLSPDMDVFGEDVFDLKSEGVWNVSDPIALPDGSASGEFSFNVE